jgi:hypothetical protein
VLMETRGADGVCSAGVACLERGRTVGTNLMFALRRCLVCLLSWVCVAPSAMFFKSDRLH